jgi:hypothetical protein
MNLFPETDGQYGEFVRKIGPSATQIRRRAEQGGEERGGFPMELLDDRFILEALVDVIDTKLSLQTLKEKLCAVRRVASRTRRATHLCVEI